MSNLLTHRREPFKFMLGISIVGIALLFISLSFLYIHRKSGADWIPFILPGIFWWSTALIILSSFTLQQATVSFKKDNFSNYKLFIGITLLLGIAFISTQLLGWFQLANKGIDIKSPSAAFLYMLSGLHILHIVGGIVFLLMAFINALKKHTYVDAFVYSVNPPTQLRLQLVAIYWHFVDILWIYLFLFLLYHQR